MTNEEIRKKYQREGGALGENSIAITRFINMLHTHGKSENADVRNIVENIENLQSVAPNFTIFQSEKDTFFMHQFNALQIDTGNDDMVLSHEFGHGVLGMINHLEVPEDFEKIIEKARSNCINPENKDSFIEFVEYISDRENEKRTQAEKGPVSDIISSIFQYPALTFAKTNKTCVLPSYHLRDYYFDEEKGERKVEKIFDEDFANFYALTANNCTKELDMLRKLLGEEWMQSMQKELEKASKTLQISREEVSQEGAMGKIKDIILGVKESDIPKEIESKKENEMEQGEH